MIKGLQHSKYHGIPFTAIINTTRIEGLISCEEDEDSDNLKAYPNGAWLCQNSISGNNGGNRLGYKYSWLVADINRIPDNIKEFRLSKIKPPEMAKNRLKVNQIVNILDGTEKFRYGGYNPKYKSALVTKILKYVDDEYCHRILVSFFDGPEGYEMLESEFKEFWNENTEYKEEHPYYDKDIVEGLQSLIKEPLKEGKTIYGKLPIKSAKISRAEELRGVSFQGSSGRIAT